MCVQNLNFVALPVPEIMALGVLKKFGQSLDTPRLPFLQDFLWAFVRIVGIDPGNVSAKFAGRSFTRPEIIAIEVLGGGCEPPIFRMVPFERLLASSYRHSVVTFTFPLSLRVS